MGTSAAPLVKGALVDGIALLFAADPDVGVVYGPRGSYTRPDLVAVLGVTTEVDVATIGANRARSEAHEVTIVISSSRPGTVDAQRTVTERAYALLAIIDAWLIASPNETLAITGAQQTWARVARVELTEPADSDVLAKGRQANLTVTVAVRTRI
jgi:hypothetical protein